MKDQGIDGARDLRPISHRIHQLGDCSLVRGRDVQALTTAAAEARYCRFQLRRFDLECIVSDRLVRLHRKQLVDDRRAAMRNRIADDAVAVWLFVGHSYAPWSDAS